MRAPAVLLATMLAAPLASAQVPQLLGYQGRLLKADGTPQSGVVAITFTLFDSAESGQELWREPQELALTQGFYATFLGRNTPLPATLLGTGERWLELTVDGEALRPRQRIGSVLFALKASQAVDVVGGVVDASEVKVGGNTVLDGAGRLAGNARYLPGPGVEIDSTNREISLLRGCAAGQLLKWDGAAWACAADIDTQNAGTVQTVTAATPLAVANGNSNPELSLPRSGVGQDGYLAAEDFSAFAAKLHEAALAPGSGLEGTARDGTPLSLLRSCEDGQLLKWNASSSSWGCAPDVNSGGTVTNVIATAPLAVANGATTPAVSLPRADATADGYLAGEDFAQFTAKLGVGSTAGGDLSGALPDPSVMKLRGRPLDATAPANGQVLKWNGSSWSASEDVDTNSGGTVTNVTATAPLAVANGTSTPALSMAKASGSASGYLAATDFAAFAAKLGSGSAAGGDLSGTLPSPTVAKLQGRAVATTAPGNNQVLKWNGSAWAPATDANSGGTVTSVTTTGPLAVANGSTTPALSIAKATASADGYLDSADFASFAAKLGSGSAAGGDLSGTLPNPTVAKLQGRSVATQAPANGQVLKWNGTAWAPGSDNNTTAPGGTAGGDLAATYPNPTVAKLQGRSVATTAPASNQVLKWNGTAWAPAGDADSGGTVTSVTTTGPLAVANGSTTPALSIAKATASADGYLDSADFAVFAAKLGSGSAAGGDLSGTLPNPTVAKLQGRSVLTTAPTSGQVLKWNGTAWAPGSDNNTVAPGGAAGGDLAATYPNPTVAKLQGRAVLSTAPTTGQVLEWNGSAWAPGSDNNTIAPGGAASGDLSGSYPGPTVSRLQGRSVLSTTPTTGQALIWNGSAWGPGNMNNVNYLGVYKRDGNAPTTYTYGIKRYVVEASPAYVGRVVPIDVSITDELCRDIDGCKVTIQMVNWDGTQNVASRAIHLFVATSGNHWRIADHDTSGVDANFGNNEWAPWDCYFTDAERSTTTSNGRSDSARGFGLLNCRGCDYNDSLTTCRAAFED